MIILEGNDSNAARNTLDTTLPADEYDTIPDLAPIKVRTRVISPPRPARDGIEEVEHITEFASWPEAQAPQVRGEELN
ncbi:MAG: hypothetical protein FJ319_05025 [SAR202 cluster bacterium]|nr:hypothetical protein [SAR202 cluster bacterium]